jgi:fructokinase
LSEASDGAAAAGRVVFGVILGTGVGGGLVVDKKLWPGANHIAGEWGHNPLPLAPQHFGLADRVCYCGRSNCIETFLSGPGLALTYTQLGGELTTAKIIASLALSGESLAQQALSTYYRQLALGLSQLINTIDPDVIVVGGGLSHLNALYSEVPALWAGHVFNDQVVTRLVPAHFGDASGVRGAAWLWPVDN